MIKALISFLKKCKYKERTMKQFKGEYFDSKFIKKRIIVYERIIGQMYHRLKRGYHKL